MQIKIIFPSRRLGLLSDRDGEGGCPQTQPSIKQRSTWEARLGCSWSWARQAPRPAPDPGWKLLPAEGEETEQGQNVVQRNSLWNPSPWMPWWARTAFPGWLASFMTINEAKGIEITCFNLCNRLSLGAKYFSLALLLYIGLFLRHPNFSKCLASKESQGKNSVCLGDLKKDNRQESKWCFAGCNFAKLEGCFILFKSNPDQCILLWHLTHNNKPLSKPHPYWERQRRWFYNILPGHNLLFPGAGYILLLHLCIMLYKARRQRDKAVTRAGRRWGHPAQEP